MGFDDMLFFFVIFMGVDIEILLGVFVFCEEIVIFGRIVIGILER